MRAELDEAAPRSRDAHLESVARAHTEAAERLQDRIEQLSDEMVYAYRREIPAYAALDDVSAVVHVGEITRANVSLILRAVVDDVGLDAPALTLLRDVGRRSAQRGFPLHAIIRAYQTGMRIVSQALVDEVRRLSVDEVASSEAAARIQLRIIDLVGEVSGVVAEAFLAAEQELRTAKDPAHRELFEELLAGPFAAPQPLRARAEQAGYRLGEAHLVAVLRVDPAPVESALDGDTAGKATAVVARALRSGSPEIGQPLARARGREVVAIFPAERDGAENAVRKLLHEMVAGGRRAQLRMLAATGQVERGLAGIPRSYGHAVQALETARTVGRTASVVSYLEMAPLRLLIQEPSLATDLWQASVEPLDRYDADHGSQLVSTLNAYLEERGNVTATARRLYMHRHTLCARLERIEALTGRSLKDRDDLLALELGLRAHDIPRPQRALDE